MYTAHMLGEKHVNTRELLRNFRKYKQMLQTGAVHIVYITVDDGQELTMTVQKKVKSGAELVKRIRAMPHPIHIKRHPKLFNDLIRTWR